MDAVSNENLYQVKELIEKGCNVNVTNKQGYSAIWYAFEMNNQEIINYLIEKGADIDIFDTNNISLLMFIIDTSNP